MRPGVRADLVTIRKTTLGLERPVNHVGPDIEESGLLLLLLHKVVECVVGAVGSVIEGKAPGVCFGKVVNIWLKAGQLGRVALLPCPPAIRVLDTVVVDT